ncbi:MAG: DegV family EDD domain-containing protein [Lachnospiraceae bacterium]|nr:DegV family EDD domain-containing protein [Lachnospiraceae bacterium]
MIKRFINFVSSAVKDPNREFSERVFLIFTIISDISVLIALICDIITGEDIREIIVLTATIIIVPIITFTCLYKNKIRLAIRIIITGLMILVLPAIFFFGGGVGGGGVIWFIFAFMYVGLVISGRWRRLVLTLIIILTLVCYYVEYAFPDLVPQHERGLYYIDSALSLILVGIVCFVMTMFQNRLFMEENARAKKEAERAEELNRSQNRFFSSMSHEIRTPINSILGLNELILRDPDISDEIVKDATGIQGSGKMLLALINDILDFSKMEAGSMDIVPVDYRIADMLSEIVNMIWQKAHDKGLKFEVSIDPKVPSVLFGDEVRIKQILVNLLNNAVKYTPDGSVTLHIECEQITDDTATINYSISDTGMGIKKEVIPLLFDAFKRVDEEKNRNIEGTGLGLNIVKQLLELMGGQISVNSVYGEGSTFTVELKQGISDSTEVGELNIHNYAYIKRSNYESSFRAPEAKILIVDDNEMNLEVEKKLLTETELEIDTALNGKEALEIALKKRYDVILMDHLMPEMDGIECLERLRSQTGGLNRITPVIILTANAGSENRDLYNRAGFDGYLVKPVSGETLEDTLVKYISKDKLIIRNKIMRMREDINTLDGYSRKAPVVITSSTMCDLPVSLIQKLKIPVIPFVVQTEDGIFKDAVQIDSDELVRYISKGKKAISSPPDVSAYTEFFAGALKYAHHLIHISLTTSMSDDFKIASEAAQSFDNVTIINSGCLSSSTGIMVLIACKLAQQNLTVQEIIQELELIKPRLKCSFIIDTTDHMSQKGLISPRVQKIAKALSLHPSLKIKDDVSGIGGAWIGNTRRSYKSYIHKAFPVDVIPDSEVAFITYVDIPEETLMWIKEEIGKIAYFEHIIFMKASAAISSNCGPGAFGILYFIKGNKSYNISSFLDNEDEPQKEDEDETDNSDLMSENDQELNGIRKEALSQIGKSAEGESKADAQKREDLKWYDRIEGINGKTAIENSGSEDAFKSVLKIFYDSIPAKSDELNGFYSNEDWENYTIKIHALKSSSKLIGAMELGERAQLLETAGKEKNIDYIKEKHEAFMEDYVKYRELLADIYKEGRSNDSNREADDETIKGPAKPLADEYLMEGVYEAVREAAEAMDCGTIEDVLKELDEYTVPEADREKIESISDMAKKFDYEGIVGVIGK